MQAMNDMALLREYATRNSEDAFAALVSRRVNFVYSAALRQVHRPDLAEEVTQAVFIILARKAKTISDKTLLTGWLFRTTRFAAISQIRAAARRQRHEQEAQMQTELQSAAADDTWEQLAPLLDEALAALNETDRRALLLRYFEKKSLAEVGNILGTGEDTARKRVGRALEKLHRFFHRRGLSSTTAILAGTISANSVQAAPVALAKSVTAVAIAKGSIATASTLTLVKGTLKLMILAKLKIAALISAAVILATGTTVVVNKVVAQSSSVDGIASPSSSIDDSAWAKISARALNELPPVFILRPTHFAMPGTGIGGGMAKAGNKMLGRAIPFDELMSMAYEIDPAWVVSPADKPSGGYDLLMTTPDASNERLQAEIKRQLGYVAHRVSRQTDVLLLTLKQTDAPGLRPSPGRSGGQVAASSTSSSSAGAGVKKKTITFQDQPVSNLVKNLQGSFDRPILDRTGLTGNYDISLHITLSPGVSESDAIARALPAQLGLELVPARELIELLTVEKVN
jgi:uncharacterized protein (TIGR03435 family)